MLKRLFWTTITIAATCALALPAYAGSGMDHSKMDHSKMDHSKMDHSKMDHSAHVGAKIHESTVDGHRIAYHLIDMKSRMEAMKGMKGMSMKGHDMSQMKSHHLMLYITGPAGETVSEAKVGFKIEGPTGNEEKTMAMAMRDGFGADVDLKAKGVYQIKTKAVAGSVKLRDEFKYAVD